MPAGVEVAVVGGGVIGCAISYFLAQAKVKVTVLERDRVGSGASGAAAGMLAPLAETQEPGPLLQMGLESLRSFPELALVLREETGIEIEYVPCGILRLAFTEEEEASLRRGLGWQQQSGLPVEWLEGDEVRKLEPSLSPEVRGALYSKGEAQVQSSRLVQALAEGAKRAGASLREGTPVLGLSPRKDGGIGVRLPQGTLEAEQVILAAGAWTGLYEEWAGCPLPVHPVRGQILALGEAPVRLRHVLFSHRGYLVPKRDGTVWLGATQEQVGYDTRVTAQGIGGLLRGIPSLVPALGQATLQRAWAGLRPGSADGQPLLGPVPGHDRILVAAGHYRNGILLSLSTGRLMAQLVTQGKSSLPWEPFSPGRFLQVRPS